LAIFNFISFPWQIFFREIFLGLFLAPVKRSSFFKTMNPETKAKAQEKIKMMTEVGPPLSIPIWPTIKIGWQCFKENWKTSALMALIAVAAYLIFYLFAALSGAGFVGYVIYFFIQPIPTMLLIILYFRRARNQDTSLKACWDEITLSLYFSAASGTWLYSLLVSIGFLLLIIPGLYLMVCWVWWIQDLIMNYENNASFCTKIWESFKASRAQVMRNWCNVFLFMFSCIIILVLGQLTFFFGLITYPVAIFAITEGYFIAFGINPQQQQNAQVNSPVRSPVQQENATGADDYQSAPADV
jgi:hypothetical protein